MARRGFHGWHERGYLPHRDAPGLVQFVTFRLADSYPAVLRSEWEHLFRIEDEPERKRQLQAYLDCGRGDSFLRQSQVAEIVEKSLQLFDGKRYSLRAWVIMPNHVHVLFQLRACPMSRVVTGWKTHTAREANRLLGRTGPFWAADYYDTYMRDADHERRTIRYIEQNPAKAHLVSDASQWPWSSLRKPVCGDV